MPPAAAISAENSAEVRYKSPCDNTKPIASPTASEAAPTSNDSSATTFITSPVDMPSIR